MKNVRMFLTGAIVIAIVGSSLAFTKSNPNLFQCNTSNECVAANFSSFNPNNGTGEVGVTDKYTTNNATSPVCFAPGSTTVGCKTNPTHAWAND